MELINSKHLKYFGIRMSKFSIADKEMEHRASCSNCSFTQQRKLLENKNSLR